MDPKITNSLPVSDLRAETKTPRSSVFFFTSISIALVYALFFSQFGIDPQGSKDASALTFFFGTISSLLLSLSVIIPLWFGKILRKEIPSQIAFVLMLILSPFLSFIGSSAILYISRTISIAELGGGFIFLFIIFLGVALYLIGYWIVQKTARLKYIAFITALLAIAFVIMAVNVLIAINRSQEPVKIANMQISVTDKLRLCEKIADDGYEQGYLRFTCTQLVNLRETVGMGLENAQTSYCDSKDLLLLKNECLSNLFNNCYADGLFDEQEQILCRQISAKIRKSVKLCYRVGNEIDQENCFQAVVEGCKSLPPGTVKESQFCLNTYSPQVCQEKERNSCLSNIARQLSDRLYDLPKRSQVCEQISDERTRDYCFLDTAKDLRDIDSCDKISASYTVLRENCKKHF